MKYKIEQGTETFAKLEVLHKEMKRVDRAVWKLLKELRANRCVQGTCLAGGLRAVEMNKKPEGWVHFSKPSLMLFAPKATNKEWLEKFKKLPTVPYSAMNDIVGFKGGNMTADGDGFSIVRCPGIEFGKTVMLLDTGPKSKYVPPNGDIVEILESEYDRLSEAIEKGKA